MQTTQGLPNLTHKTGQLIRYQYHYIIQRNKEVQTASNHELPGKHNKTKIVQVYNWQRKIATWCFRSKDNRNKKKQPSRKAIFIGSWEHMFASLGR